jgi:hypothetical protein
MSISVVTVESSFLTSWKEIAQYMGKGVRTVQRWEQRFQLPVRRVMGSGYKGTVLARPCDLDAWVTSSWARRARGENTIAVTDAPEALHQLRENLAIAKSLQETNLALQAEFAKALRSLVTNCRDLSRKNSLEVN